MNDIKLTNGMVALVDDEDYEWLNSWEWRCNSSGYAERCSYIKTGKRKFIYMHRVILNTPDGMCTDHINHNTLDNRRENLRICDRSQNSANMKRHRDNRAGIKGVSWVEREKKWHACIRYHYKGMSLGYHDTKEKAAEAYNKKAKELFGEYAYTDGKK